MAGILTNLGTVAGSKIISDLLGRLDLSGERKRKEQAAAAFNASLPQFQKFQQDRLAQHQALIDGADPQSLAPLDFPQVTGAFLENPQLINAVSSLFGLGGNNPFAGMFQERGKQQEKTTGHNNRVTFKETLNPSLNGSSSADSILNAVNARNQVEQQATRDTNQAQSDLSLRNIHAKEDRVDVRHKDNVALEQQGLGLRADELDLKKKQQAFKEGPQHDLNKKKEARKAKGKSGKALTPPQRRKQIKSVATKEFFRKDVAGKEVIDDKRLNSATARSVKLEKKYNVDSDVSMELAIMAETLRARGVPEKQVQDAIDESIANRGQ